MSLLDTASLVVTPNGTKAGKLYSVVPSSGAGDLSVTRATTATRVNSSGLIESVASNVPRLDYTNGTCPSILVEPQRTNLFNYSEQFDNLYWTKTFTNITANATVSPDGTQNADKLTASTTGTDRRIQRTDVLLAGTYTTSIFVKEAELNTIRMYAVDFSSQATFTLTGNGIISGQIGSATAIIEKFINGWYRCSMTVSFAGGATQGLYFNLGNALSGQTINAGEGVYIWGAQLEAGSYATSYIPTTSASVTRNADQISKSGISSLIGQTEGTIFVGIYDYNFTPNNTSPYVEIYSDSNNRILIAKNTSNQYQVVIRTSGVTVLNILTGAISGNTKIAVSYKENDCVVYVNGILVGTDTNVSIPICNSLYLGESVTGTKIQKDVFNLTALWKTRLTNTQLAQLTTI
jgi:hypothetical protein